MASNAWVVFRKARIVLLGFSAVLALALSSLFIFLTIKEWLEYSVQQRVIVIAIVGSHVFTAIFLYLMIVVQFRLWVDVARVALVILLETGGSVVFAIETFPCRKIGLQSTCRTFLAALQNVGWVVPGVLGVYVFVLVIMHHVPKPSTQLDDLEAFFPTTYPVNEKPNRTSVNSQKGLMNAVSSKRSSTGSAGSSFIQNYTPSIISAREAPPISVVGPDGNREMSSFRTGTPPSFQPYHSHSFSTGSSSPGMPQPQPFMGTPQPVAQYGLPYHSHSYSAGPDRGMPPRPFMGSPQLAPSLVAPLPNPFMDPLPRQRSPLLSEDSMSVHSRSTLSPPSSAQSQGLPSSPRPLLQKLSPSSRNDMLPAPQPPMEFTPRSSPSPAPTVRSRVASPGVRISQLPVSLVASPARRPSPRLTSPDGRAQTPPQGNRAYVPLLLSPALAPMVGLPQRPPGYGALNY